MPWVVCPPLHWSSEASVMSSMRIWIALSLGIVSTVVFVAGCKTRGTASKSFDDDNQAAEGGATTAAETSAAGQALARQVYELFARECASCHKQNSERDFK